MRAPKSRAGCHFAAAIGLGRCLKISHRRYRTGLTINRAIGGGGIGRGLDHFRKEGARLIPPPTGDDPYEDEAYRLWAKKQQQGR